MAKDKLTERFVKTVTEDGMHNDGGGLNLFVRNHGRAKSWVFRYHGRSMSLGPLATKGLARHGNGRARRACRFLRGSIR
jgi:hypothetical protein